MADIIQAQIIDEEIVTPSADPVAHNMPGGGAVESVNGKTGAVVLTADDVGAVAAETFNTAMQGKQDKLTAGAGAEIKDGVLSATSLGITGAAVGQIARITAVDSDGKPTAWEPVDMASGGGGGEDPVIVYDTVLTEEVGLVEITEDKNGNPFNLKSFAVICVAVGTSSNNQNGYGNMYINGDKFLSSQDNFTRQQGSTRTNLTLSIYNKYFRITSFHYRDSNVVNEDGYLDNNISNSMLYVNNNAIYRIFGFRNEQSNIANSFKIKCEQNTVFGVGSRIIIYDLG